MRDSQRITPLSTRAYFRAKVLSGYVLAGTSLLLLYASGVSLGVSLPTVVWLEMTGLILVRLLPFAALGIALGHVLNVEALGAVTGGLVSLLALVSGTWFPISNHGFIHDLAQNLPSYWLVRASHITLEGSAWGTRGWVVVAVWTVLLTAVARFAYLRDTQRV